MSMLANGSLVGVTVAVALGASPEDPITRKNWLKHPRIQAIRQVVKQLQEQIDSGQLRHEDKPACEAPSLDVQRDAYRDKSGRIRRYVWQGGSDDSAYWMDSVYDEQGRLVFVHATMGAVNNSKVEFRIYFEGGKEIWRDRKATGPGYPWLEGFPDQHLVKDPAAALARPPDCGR